MNPPFPNLDAALTTPLAEGKTKAIYAYPDNPAWAVMVQKDTISAGDGARRHRIVGKGALSSRTAHNVFALLGRSGIATHFIAAPAAATMIVRRCTMLPLEVVMRRLATGSFLRRVPGSVEGQRFDPPLVEFFLKDDARHDPQIQPDEIVAQQLATVADVDTMITQGRAVFAVLETAWAAQEITLVDLKIEFGRADDGTLIVADMIDHDSWRLWPHGDKTQMLDKQIYRNMPEVDDHGLDLMLQKYARVADLTEQFLITNEQ